MSEDKVSHPLRQLRNLFITGLLVVVPLGTTVWIVYKLFNLADSNIRNWLKEPFQRLCQLLFDGITINEHGEMFLRGHPFDIPPYGIGLVVTLLVILAAGLLARNLIGRRLISLLEKLMLRVPVVRQIYLAIKQISEAFLQRKRGLFDEVVLIEYPRRGIYSLGFVTSAAPASFQRIASDLVCVFVSTTPNPTSGVLVLVPRQDVIPLNIPVEEGMKMVISAGIVIPEHLAKPPAREEEGGTPPPAAPQDDPSDSPGAASRP